MPSNGIDNYYIDPKNIKLGHRAKDKRRGSHYAELRKSIKAHGVIQPVLVTDKLALLDGLDRVTIALELGLTEIPHIVAQAKWERLKEEIEELPKADISKLLKALTLK